jgi:hypothetical protein
MCAEVSEELKHDVRTGVSFDRANSVRLTTFPPTFTVIILLSQCVSKPGGTAVVPGPLFTLVYMLDIVIGVLREGVFRVDKMRRCFPSGCLKCNPIIRMSVIDHARSRN